MPEDLGGQAHAQNPPIIKKIQHGEHAHHGGAWKVAYADMVTALMALFIVLWILSQSDEVIQNVAGYFRDPVGFTRGGLPSVLDGGAATHTPSLLDEPVAAAERGRMAGSAEQWREWAAEIRRALEALPSFAAYRDQLVIETNKGGLRITLIQSDEAPIFEVGGTALHAEAHELLKPIAEQIRGLEYAISIEGHTDSRPFPPGSRISNWELSTGRANSARRELERLGVAAQRMVEVRGLADRELYNPLDPEDARNRRVAIQLLSDEALAAHRRAARLF